MGREPAERQVNPLGKLGGWGLLSEAAAWREWGEGARGCVQGNWCWSWLLAAFPAPWRPGGPHWEPSWRSFLLPLPYHPRTARHQVWSFLLLNLSAAIPFSPSLSHHPNLPFCRSLGALPSSPRSPTPSFHHHRVHPPLLQALPCPAFHCPQDHPASPAPSGPASDTRFVS